MKILCILALAVTTGLCVAADPTWNPADAAKEAEQDIRSGHIKFYWAGSVGVGPVGALMEVAKKYPRLMPELAVSPTTYHFANERKNMPAGTTRRFTPTSHRSIRKPFFDCHSERSEAATQPRKLRGEARLFDL